jgi:hypothetical protein
MRVAGASTGSRVEWLLLIVVHNCWEKVLLVVIQNCWEMLLLILVRVLGRISSRLRTGS